MIIDAEYATSVDINRLTRKQFELLPRLNHWNDYDVDSIVLLPTKRHHDSGYNLYSVVACENNKAIGVCDLYDTFSIFMSGKYNRVGIDCLRGSGLMRIFLPRNEYVIKPIWHEIRRKDDKYFKED